MNRTILLSAAALAAASALAFVPTYAQTSDDPQNDSASDSNSAPIDLDKIHGPVYLIQDPSTGETYILVPPDANGGDDDASAGVTTPSARTPPPAVSPVRGVTYWA